MITLIIMIRWHRLEMLVCVLGMSLLAQQIEAFAPHGSSDAPQNIPASARMPSARTPAALREFWLRFHETDLCRELDTVFSFHDSGLEIWCAVGDEKSYRKLKDLSGSFQASNEITIYATRPPAGSKKPEEKAPPPSLWNNEELLAALQNVTIWSLPPGLSNPATGGDGRVDVVKQRLIMYAERLQELSGNVRSYGSELPALARLGVGQEMPQAQRKRFLSLCLAHAQAIDKNAARLVDNITPAVPKSNRRTETAGKTAKKPAPGSVTEIADEIAAVSARTARGVRSFLFPRDHTVELGDLRDPGLLESLRALREGVAELQKAASRTGR